METTTLPDFDFQSLINGKPVRSDAEVRNYVLQNTIFPTVSRWGFDARFHAEPKLIPEQAALYRDVTALLRGKGAIVALVGPRGLGKTTIASQLAIERAWSNYESGLSPGPRRYGHVIYRKAAKIITRYKPLFADFGSVETEALLESLDYLCRHQELLVIDELHDCDDQKMKLRVLTDLIDRRYSCLRDTILIANQTAADFAASVGDSILSRLNEHGAILECSWTGFRG